MANSCPEYTSNQGPLGEFDLKTRVDLARMVAYRYFLEANSPRDFYFEDLLNCFIALVQQPVSFAVFRRSKQDEVTLCFHFCSDKEHRGWFEKELLDHPPQDTADQTEIFNLFPGLLGDEYYISILLMHTKVPSTEHRTTRIYKVSGNSKPQNSEDYISMCASAFFEKKWDGFHTLFCANGKAALLNSLVGLEKNNRGITDCSDNKWPPTFDEVFQARLRLQRPNTEKEKWHSKVEHIFARALNSARFGSQSVSKLMYITQNSGEANTSNNQGFSNKCKCPQNMMVMYRSFDRDEYDTTEEADEGRHNNENGSYQYNLRFLLDEGGVNDTGSIRAYFDHLTCSYADAPHRYEEGSARLLYRKILDGEAASSGEFRNVKIDLDILQIIILWMDEFFWATLRRPNGLDTCLDILKAPIGEKSRSFCDPVMHTGIIHLNKLFERSGGLDRVDLTEINDKRDEIKLIGDQYKERSLESVEFISRVGELLGDGSFVDDLKRIVVFYYAFCGMAAESGMDPLRHNPKDLTAVLMPVKMRGAAWAVTIHATFMDAEVGVKSYEYLPLWMANFLLMTSQRQNYGSKMDVILWDRAQRRVTRLLEKEIGKFGVEHIDQALGNVNELLEREQRLVPYVFPKFSTSVNKNEQLIPGRFIELFPPTEGSHLILRICWTITENPFFVSRQPWSGEPTRMFEQAVSLGVMHGLQQYFSKLQKNTTKEPNNA